MLNAQWQRRITHVTINNRNTGQIAVYQLAVTRNGCSFADTGESS